MQKLEERKNISIRHALVLDLDGTVRRSKSGAKFIKDAEDIEIIPSVLERVAWFRREGYLIIGVSNQGGVAHGIKTEQQVRAEIAKTHLLLDNAFDSVLFCPFMEGGKGVYARRSLLRKPNYGMLAAAEARFFNEKKICIDWDNSLFVGDSHEDELCAAHASIAFCHIKDFLACDTEYIWLMQPRSHEASVTSSFLERNGFTLREDSLDDGDVLIKEYYICLFEGKEYIHLSINEEHCPAEGSVSIETALATGAPHLAMSDEYPSRGFVMKIIALFKEYREEVKNGE